MPRETRTVTLIRGARQLITLRGLDGPRRGADLRNLGLIQDGAVLIENGLIVEVGPTRRLENLALARQAEEIDATGCVVMPGFVDCSTQIASGPPRVLDRETRTAAKADENGRLTGSLLALARSVQDLSFRALQGLALGTLENAVRHGTTALEAKSGFGLTDAAEAKILRVYSTIQKKTIPIVPTYFCAHPTPGYDGRSGQYLDSISAKVLPQLKRRKLAEFVEVACGAQGFAPAQASHFLSAAQGLGFGVRLYAGPHAHPRSIQLAAEHNAASIDDVRCFQPEDAAVLAHSDTIATLSPGAFWGCEAEPRGIGKALIDRGVAVALATNYSSQGSASQSMQMTIALACRILGMTAAEAITASTINAAHALGRATRIGSLEAGKSADLLLLGVPDYREIPYHFGINLVNLVMSHGTILARRSEVKWPAP